MQINNIKVGETIQSLRKAKNITQNDLGERLNVSPQAVSKWERGETLPDTAILPDLASVLETTIDFILTGGEKVLKFNRRVSVAEIKSGVEMILEVGNLLGQNSTFYRGAIEGIDKKMNIEFEKYMSEPFTKEAMVAEAVVQAIMDGDYVDLTDIRKSFEFDHWIKNVTEFAKKYGID